MNPLASKTALVLACASLVALGGCATTTGGRPKVELQYSDPVPLEAADPDAALDPTAATEGTESQDGAADAGPELPSSRPGSGTFINDKAARRVPPGPGATGEVTFNFEGESLHAVIKAILGDFLQQNYVIAPGVQGNVTFSTAKPLRGDQALSILEMLLRWNNATMVWQDGRYTILPVAQALPGNLTPRTGSPENARGYEVRAVPLQYISALEMEKLLKPYAKPEGVINVDPARNMIVLAGTRAELENYLQTVQVFDVDWLAGMSVGVFTLQQAEAAKAVTDLEKIFGEGSNTPLAGMFRFMPLEGLNAVMVITPQPKYLDTIEEWLERLDLGGGEAGQRLYVYDVKNVKAVDLAATLADVFGGGGGASSARSAPPSGDRLMPGLEPVEIRTVGSSGNVSPSPGTDGQKAAAESNTDYRNNAPREGGPAGAASGPTVDASGGIALGASEEVRISASEENNALLVMATSGQWESIRRVIERLDTIPLQVHIEAQIVRVTLNDNLEYGVQWFFENGITGTASPPRAGALGRNGWGDHSGTINAATGVAWSFLGPDATAVITALDEVSDATVLSAPSLVVLNNKTANINVGQQIPVASSFYGGGINDPSNPNTGINQNSYVQFRQTGITLNVTPRVNPGGLVFMEVEQEESAPGAGPVVGGNQSVDNRSISTEVAVQSGQTLVLGGLIKSIDTTAQGGLPGLSRIPVIGGLFGGRSRESNREELLVLITPRVVSNGEEARRMTEDYVRKFRGIEPLRVRVEP